MRFVATVALILMACRGPSPEPVTGTPSLGQPDYLIDVPRFVVEAGEEVEESYCTSLATGGPLLVRAFRLDATVGLHHTQLFQMGRDSFRLVFATSTLVHKDYQELPEGVVLPVDGDARLCLEYHYLNATTEAVAAEIQLGLYTTKPMPNQQLAGMFAFQTRQISIPAGQSAASTFSCRFPRDVEIITLVPHTHTRGRRLVARIAGGPRDGELLHEWDQLLDSRTHRFDPALSLNDGEGFSVSCEWDNPSDRPIGYGVSAAQEMCLIAGLYYPAQTDLFGEVLPSAATTDDCGIRTGARAGQPSEP